MLVYLLWVLPILSLIFINFLKNANQIKFWSLFFSILIFLTTLSFWFLFDLNFIGFYFLKSSFWSFNNQLSFNITLGLDGISLLFLTLSTFLTPVCLLSSYKLTFNSSKIFCSIYFLLTFFLIGSFTVLNLLVFFVFFESIVPLMFLIIGVFGSRLQKVRAAHYFFIYTIIGSLFMLLAILWIGLNFNTLNYQDLIWIRIDDFSQKMLWLGFFLALASKLPLVPFRIWLPQAHVEAPVSGSVLLAGILLKLGGYGFIRFVFVLFPKANEFFSPIVLTLSLISLFYAALTTLRQTDFKRFIAYSSVSRMAVVTLGLFSFNEIAFSGSIVLMLAHGFSSSGLFMVVSLLYNRHQTRAIRYFRGLALSMPLLATIFLIFSLANLALPLTMNFIGEFMILLGIFQSFPIIGLLANLSIIFSASYSLFLFNRICFGAESVYLLYLNRDLTRIEIYSFLPLILALIFFGLHSQYLELIQTNTLKNFFF